MGYKVAVVGATGAVGREILRILAERDFPVSDIAAIASERSVGREVSFGDKKTVKLKPLKDFDFKGWDLALFATSSSVSARYVPEAVKAGCYAVDNSSQFRMDKNVPLVIPEVNPHALDGYKGKIIANPNCSTAQLTLPVKALKDAFGLERIVVATYQSVSGVGTGGMDELFDQTKKSFLSDGGVPRRYFPKQIAFNVIPKIGDFVQDGMSDEEEKMEFEMRKIVGDDIKVVATCARVPVFIGHSEAVVAECAKPVTPAAARAAMAKMPGVVVFDDPKEDRYITPIEVVGEDAVYVSRIRKDRSRDNSIAFWCVSNNLRKGAALNVVQIAELLVKKGML